MNEIFYVRNECDSDIRVMESYYNISDIIGEEYTVATEGFNIKEKLKNAGKMISDAFKKFIEFLQYIATAIRNKFMKFNDRNVLIHKYAKEAILKINSEILNTYSTYRKYMPDSNSLEKLDYKSVEYKDEIKDFLSSIYNSSESTDNYLSKILYTQKKSGMYVKFPEWKQIDEGINNIIQDLRKCETIIRSLRDKIYNDLENYKRIDPTKFNLYDESEFDKYRKLDKEDDKNIDYMYDRLDYLGNMPFYIGKIKRFLQSGYKDICSYEKYRYEVKDQ